MSEYTYADVIIDPNDERVKIGEKYYMGGTPNEVLESANEANDFFINTLIEIGNVKCWYPFEGENQRVYCCLIKPKNTTPYDVIKDEIEKALEAKGWRQTESVKRFSIYVRDSGSPFYSSISINSEKGKIFFDICDKESGYRTITECHFDYMVFKEDVIKMNIPTIKLEIKL
nr:MAG TPA: hypothetical protein [Caudoviricetes sp.]